MNEQRDPFEGVKDVGTGRQAGEFAPGVPRCPKEYLLGVVVKLEGAVLFEDWDSDFGTSDFALVRFQLQDGRRFTTLLGGQACVKSARVWIKQKAFPRLGVLDTLASTRTGNTYYRIRSREPDDRYELLQEPTEQEMWPDGKPVVAEAAG